MAFQPILFSGFTTGGSSGGGGGGGVNSIANVGSTPNAQGGSIVGTVLTLQPADGTHPGLLTSGTQSIGGNKTFTGSISASNFSGSSSGSNTGDQTITLTGAVTGSGTGSFSTTLTNSSVTGQVLTGFTSGPNSTVLATDSILQGLEKLQAQVSGAPGTVTSVGLSLPSIFTVTVSPITSSGSLTAVLASETANTFFAAPNGSSGTPTFRSIVSADVPTLNQNTTGTASNITATSNSTLTTLSSLSLPGSQVTGNITGNAANITATSNSTLTTLSSLSLPGSQVTGNISGNAANVTGTVAIANGGTGQVTAATAFNALNPMTTTGDLIYESATGVSSRLAIGSTNQILTVIGGIPSWQPAAASGANTTLSNLTSPTAINQALLPDTDLTRNLGSATDRWNALFTASVNSGNQPITLQTGNVTGTASGTVSINSGNVSGTGASGQLNMGTGSTASGASGSITLISGFPSSGSSSGTVSIGSASSSTAGSGLISISSGAQSTSGTSGSMQIATGQAASGASTGVVSLASGTVNAGSGNSGTVTISSGNTSAGNSGTVTISSGTAGGTRGSIVLNGSSINASTTQIHNVVDPSSAQDAATKNYVDTSLAALNPADAVYAATIGSNIAGTYINGVAGVGATFTTTATGTFTIDGVTPPLNARILIKDQTSGFQNGVYNITTLGTIGVSTVFTRSLDYNTASEMNSAGLIPVINGTLNALSSWQQVATITTVGTDSLVFNEFTANPSLYLLKANNLSDVASKSTSFNNLSPMTTAGDIIYENNTPSGTRLPIGSNGNVLTVVSGLPAWSPPASGGITGNYFSGYMPQATTWSTTTAGYADPTPSGSNTLSTRQFNGITVTAGPLNGPSITFTPAASTSIYLIKVSLPSFTNASNGGCAFQLIDSNGVIIVENSRQNGTSLTDDAEEVILSGIYAPATGSAVTVRIRMAVTGGTSFILEPTGIPVSSLEWYLIQIH